MGVRVRDGEETKWQPTEDDVDLGALGMAKLVAEYDSLEKKLKPLIERRDQIKAAVKALGVNRRIMVNGKEHFQIRKDGQFMSAEYRKDYHGQEEFYENFLVRRSVLEFDLEAFKVKMPDLYAKYRASKLVRVDN